MPASEPAIESLSKGAIPQPLDLRDLFAGFVMGVPFVDWSHELRLPEPPNSDQGQAFRCVAEGTSYYHWQITGNRFSPKDIYSQIFIALTGGAYLRDGPKTVCSVGQQTLEECGDPNPNTEAANRIRCTDPAKALDGLEAGYFAVDATNIDSVAACIRDNKGIIFGVHGTNAGWSDLTNPRPPQDGDPGQIWGHALYGFGFHMHNGQKCIIAKSSWCSTGITEHHIKADYFTTGNTFDGWTLIRKEQLPMYQRYVVFHQPTGRMGILVVGQTGFSDAILWAKNAAMLADLKLQYEVPANARVITLA